MDQVSFNQTIYPSNLTDFLRALDIIKRTYSIKTHNIDDVTRNINEILKFHLIPLEFKNLLSK